MKNNKLKLLDLEPIRINFILKTKIDRNIAIYLANNIENIEDFKFALDLTSKINDYNAALEFSYMACDENLSNSKYYRETLYITAKKYITSIQKSPNIIKSIRYVLCNVSVIESEGYEIILDSISKFENFKHILDIVENMIMYNETPLTKESVEKLMNLKIITTNRINVIMDNQFINQEVLDIINTIILNQDNNEALETNLNLLLDCVDRILLAKDKNTISLLLSIVSSQVDCELSTKKSNKTINFTLPKKFNY